MTIRTGQCLYQRFHSVGLRGSPLLLDLFNGTRTRTGWPSLLYFCCSSSHLVVLAAMATVGLPHSHFFFADEVFHQGYQGQTAQV